MIGRLASLLVAGALLLPAAVHAVEYREPGNVVVEAPTKLGAAKARRFAVRIAEERRRVAAWWGDTFTGEIRVRVEDNRGPARTMAPTWRGSPRGVIFVPLWRVRKGQWPSLHEIVHVYAPNGTRFLAEGLAVYAQEALHGDPAFPNFGTDLHAAAYDADDDTPLTKLDRIATPTPVKRVGDDRHMYLLSGSFVRFLIERRGLAKFRMLYAMTPFEPGRRVDGTPERWREVYGRDLPGLEAEWRAFLAALPRKSTSSNESPD